MAALACRPCVQRGRDRERAGSGVAHAHVVRRSRRVRPAHREEFAAEGAMPTLARLLETTAVQETTGPLGFVVGGNWVTSYTGTSPSRHQFLCSGQVRGGTYEPRWVGPYGLNPGGGPTPVWQWVSDAGGRVAVLDAPHAGLMPDLNGVQLVEWGAARPPCRDVLEAGIAARRDQREVRRAHRYARRGDPTPCAVRHVAPCG